MIIFFNKGAEKIFGYAANEVQGKPLDVLIPERFAEARRGNIENFARLKTLLIDFELSKGERSNLPKN